MPVKTMHFNFPGRFQGFYIFFPQFRVFLKKMDLFTCVCVCVFTYVRPSMYADMHIWRSEEC